VHAARADVTAGDSTDRCGPRAHGAGIGGWGGAVPAAWLIL
jgi:hypothetical protein